MINVSKDQRVKVWETEDKGNYTLVKMSSSRKDKRDGNYLNSNWSFVRFVGDAHKKAEQLNKGDVIVLKGAGISKEPYMKDGEKLWPKNISFVVFNFDWYDANDRENDFEEPEVESVDEDDMPF